MTNQRFKLKWDDGKHITFIKDTLNKKEYHMLMDDVFIVELLNELYTYKYENQKIKQNIEKYIKDYEEFDDYIKNHSTVDTTVKHLSYKDMKEQECNTVIGVLNHIKESYSCPNCRCNEQFFTTVYYGKDGLNTDGYVYEKRECTNCNYHEIIKRPTHTYIQEKEPLKR